MLRTSLAFALCLATPVAAELRVCNQHGETASVAIGYGKPGEWTSEGWWNAQPGDCVTISDKALEYRYYYVHTQINGAPVSDEEYEFCASDDRFTIVGDTQCEARGYETATFAQVDTGDAREWTIVLGDSSAGKRPAPVDPYAQLKAELQGEWIVARLNVTLSFEGDELAFYEDGDGSSQTERLRVSYRLAETCPNAQGSPVILTSSGSGNVGCWDNFSLTRNTPLNLSGTLYDVDALTFRIGGDTEVQEAFREAR